MSENGLTYQEAISKFDNTYVPMMEELNNHAQSQGYECVDFLIACGLLANIGKNKSDTFDITLSAFLAIANTKTLTEKDIENTCRDIVSRC